MGKPVTVRIESDSLGTLVWQLPCEVPQGVMTQEDGESVGMMLKPHLRWVLTMLITGLMMGAKGQVWFAKLRETEKRHNAEVLQITLS